MPYSLRLFVLTVLMTLVHQGWAADAPSAPGAEVKQRITQKIAQAVPGVEVVSIKPAAIDNLYEVKTNSQELIYVTGDAEHLLVGDLYRVEDSGIVNLTEARRAEERADQLAQVAPEERIRFKPEGEVKARIAVFTDIDCPYCRKLHKEVPKLNANGIEVDYLAFPRSGPGTPSFRKYISAWCADDSKAALTAAKNGESIPSKQCDNPVLSQYQLGQELGVTGTPAIILEDGRMVRGYVPADRLIQALGLEAGS
ncbi:DsbC family protein [Marinobacteraceae bacterium S3BR75-40.1]